MGDSGIAKFGGFDGACIARASCVSNGRSNGLSSWTGGPIVIASVSDVATELNEPSTEITLLIPETATLWRSGSVQQQNAETIAAWRAIEISDDFAKDT